MPSRTALVPSPGARTSVDCRRKYSYFAAQDRPTCKCGQT